MKLELGSPVHCADGPFGEVADVVIDPIARRVTHLVVAPHHQHGLARLVPIDLAEAANNGHAAVSLGCTLEHARQLPSVQEFAYLRLGEFPANDPDWDVGIENVFALPYYGYAGVGEPAIEYDPQVSMTYDRVPKGEVEIRRASEVMSADGHRLGHVDGLLVDSDDQITHVVLSVPPLGTREVTIPISAVARVKTLGDGTSDEGRGRGAPVDTGAPVARLAATSCREPQPLRAPPAFGRPRVVAKLWAV